VEAGVEAAVFMNAIAAEFDDNEDSASR